MSAEPHIVIIGGGFSGAAVAIELLRLAPNGVRVTLLEPRQSPGAGVAYSTAEPTHRINVPAARMQLAGDEEGAFDHWYRHQPAFTVDVQALRPDGSTSAQFIRAIKAKYPEQLVMADCDNFENAMLCAEAGADFVGTTMRGYTPETKGIDDIDFDFVHKLAAECPAKVIAEGHIHYPEQAVKALEAGAFALVVGGAITRPAEITARFTGAINAAKK